MDFLGGGNVFIRRRQKDQLVVGDVTVEGRGWSYVRKGLEAKQQRQALEDEKDKGFELFFLLESPELTANPFLETSPES